MTTLRTSIVLLIAIGLFVLYPTIFNIAVGQDENNPGAVDVEPEEPTIETYDIRELLVQVPNFTNAPNYRPAPSIGMTEKPGQGNICFPHVEWDEDLPSRQELVDQIVELINTYVGDPDEWLDEDSTLTELNGQLIIKTTAQNHRATRALLDSLAKRRRQMISVDAIVIEATAKQVQDLLNEKADGQHLLNPKQASSLLKEVYEDDELRIAASTRLTFFDGQRAFNSVSPAFPPREGGEAKQNPNAEIHHGIFVFDVEATISMDRKHIISTIRPDLSIVRNTSNEADRREPANGMYRATVTTEVGGAIVQSIGARATAEGDTVELMLIYRTKIANP